MNWAIRFILIMGLSPIFFAHSQEDQGDWIPPTFEEQDFWSANNKKYGTPDEALTDWFILNNRDECQRSEWTYEFDGTKASNVFQYKLKDQTGCPAAGQFSTFAAWKTTELTPVCLDPDYQIGVDSDNLDGIDRCYKSQCPNSDFFWSDGSGNSTTPSGRVCIIHPSAIPGQPGQKCEYKAIENSDGSRSQFTYQPSGEGCDCSSEAVPCYNAEDGEVTDYPQGQNGCVQLADTIMCDANPEDHCKNGVCDPGCGYVGDRFVCVESDVPDDQARACTENDPRPSCAGKNPGDCPEGSLECLDQPEDDTPPDPCVENDPRPECAGLDVGDVPTTGEGDSKNPYGGIESRLDVANRNLKEIKDVNKEIRDAIKEEIDEETINPGDVPEWEEAITKVEAITSDTDVNEDQAQFESDFAQQEGFFNNQIAGLVPHSGGCTPIAIELPYVSGAIDACSTLPQIRLVLEWIVVLLFVVYIRSAFNSLRPNGA